MDTQRTGESDVTDAATIQAVLPRHSAKRLARLIDVPVETARHWIYRHLSSCRRRELALALIEEMDRQEVDRTALRQRLAEWAGKP